MSLNTVSTTPLETQSVTPVTKANYDAIVKVLEDGVTVIARDRNNVLIDSGKLHTDETRVIQSAINYVHTNWGDGLIQIIGNGDSNTTRYLIRSRITLYGGITIQGDGMLKCVLYLNDNVNDHMFFWDDTVDGYFITFKNINLIGNSAHNTGSDLIHLGNTTNQAKDPHLFEVFLQDAGQYCYYHKSCWNDRITDCIIELAANTGVYLDAGQDVKIVGTAFKFNKDGLNVGGSGAVTGCAIVGCTFIQNTNRGCVVPLGAASGGTVCGCNFNQNGTQTSNTYDDLQIDSNHWSVVGNSFFFGQQRWAISSFSASQAGIVAVGNAFQGYGTNTPINNYDKINSLGNYNQKGQQPGTLNGTSAGTATYYQEIIMSGLKIVCIFLNGYNSTQQTITIPTAFLNAPLVINDAATGLTVTSTTTTVTIPTTSGAAKTGNAIIIGF